MKRFWAASICLVMAIGVIGWRPAAAVADELPPLVTVFDVSGSMNDQDSKGIVKLSTAKKSITDLLRAQPVNTPLGVWTYPGGSTVDGCSAGSWIGDLTPDDRPDITNVDAQIRKLSAGGNTPTGPALTAVTASLQSEGYTAATIVLVSDGESNCGPPPCEVARSVVEAGFDLTVAAVAFDIQTGDTNELQCVADVTGGTFTEADDSDALIDALSEYQARDLELEVKGPSRVLAGAHVTMTATVTNPSNNDVIGASLAVTFDDRSLVPYVPSPQYRLPTLPAGGTITRTWVVGTDSRYEGTTNWRILAGSTGAGSVMKTGQLVVTKQQLTRSVEKELKVAHVFEKLNRVIHRSRLSSRFVSVFYGELEADGNLVYVNAGHQPPILFFREPQPGKPSEMELSIGGTVIGPLPEAHFRRGFAKVHPGEVLLMLTDGIFERRDKAGEFFGVDRVRAIVRELQDRPAQAILDRLFDAAFAWGEGRPWEDDATIVVVKRVDAPAA